MWIQLNNSFLSIVQNRDNDSELLVRARVKGDIEKIFLEANVFEDVKADYKYRAFIPKQIVAKVIKEKISAINYDNFKNTIPKNDLARIHSYSNVWLELKKLQK